ncbi:hypothetical protein Aoki45_00750 [Algoriphagus sp. oki45]|uniref:helix-turn-helix domain-containing protein n=1 Tax=Algoriphagus sp. oki45 TaxID=3067294 RepID=UPI0027E5E5DA|nr:hypothetical protein Aoki45_00750 [Algoriphagus sp. oki45]
MKQPELGKKISELRKAKGLTQEELVEKCNLNVRTIQRIEAGEVTPRSYTIKALFEALDFQGTMEESADFKVNKISPFIYVGIASALVYFFLSIFEIGYEVEFIEGKEEISRGAFSFIKIASGLGYMLFMFAWVKMTQQFPNSLLKVGALMMLGASVIWLGVDLIALMTDWIQLGDYYMVKISSFGFFYVLLGMAFLGYKNRFSAIPMIVGILTIISGIFLFTGFAAFIGLIPLTMAEIGQIGLMIYLSQKIGRGNSPDSDFSAA